jgi:hypothetical protein
MHVGDQKSKSKSEAMYFLTFINDTVKQQKEKDISSNIDPPNVR